MSNSESLPEELLIVIVHKPIDLIVTNEVGWEGRIMKRMNRSDELHTSDKLKCFLSIFDHCSKILSEYLPSLTFPNFSTVSIPGRPSLQLS